MSTMRTVGALVVILASLAGPAAAQEVTPATRAAHARALEGAPDPSREAAFAERGFVATRADPEIRTADGARVVWDLRTWDYLKGPAPETVHPLFWRHNQILARHGLFRITDRIHQVRGFDAANITFVRGERGYVVIDALTTMETARAAYELVKQRLGDRPITALVYTHTHADHFGGARGLVDQKDVDSGRVPVIAPSGFLEHAVSENVLAGNAMGRRSLYQFGWFLPRGPEGQISSGVGLAISTGTQTLIPPTRLVARSGREPDGGWRAAGVPAHPGGRGARGDERLPSSVRRAAPGGERQPGHAQPAAAARRPGARRQGVGGLPVGGAAAVRTQDRCGAHRARLAALGPRGHPGGHRPPP
jgi:alkyl sulfatase BDS1-like metallo-beta-lactamase superfamily hydrolase